MPVTSFLRQCRPQIDPQHEVVRIQHAGDARHDRPRSRAGHAIQGVHEGKRSIELSTLKRRGNRLSPAGLAHTPVQSGIVTTDERAEEAREKFGGLLKQCRARIRPECASLGTFLRLPTRLGKSVTQEEVAEAAGISRAYYAMLENDHAPHVSTQVLNRIADVLMISPIERETLFRLGVPELEGTVFERPCTPVLEAFSSLRRFSRRIWDASTEREVLAIASDEIFALFGRPPLTYTAVRRADGFWELASIAGEVPAKNRFAAFIDTLRGTLSAEEIDELHLYPLLSAPGEICTEAVFRSLSIFDIFRRAQDEHRFADWSLLCGRIRSRADIVAGIAVRIPKHEYSAEQRAVLSTIALLTSLVLT
jgi:transcriptional regulator with XRE-family HTH domain